MMCIYHSTILHWRISASHFLASCFKIFKFSTMSITTLNLILNTSEIFIVFVRENCLLKKCLVLISVLKGEKFLKLLITQILIKLFQYIIFFTRVSENIWKLNHSEFFLLFFILFRNILFIFLKYSQLFFVYQSLAWFFIPLLHPTSFTPPISFSDVWREVRRKNRKDK